MCKGVLKLAGISESQSKAGPVFLFCFYPLCPGAPNLASCRILLSRTDRKHRNSSTTPASLQIRQGAVTTRRVNNQKNVRVDGKQSSERKNEKPWNERRREDGWREGSEFCSLSPLIRAEDPVAVWIKAKCTYTARSAFLRVPRAPILNASALQPDGNATSCLFFCHLCWSFITVCPHTSSEHNNKNNIITNSTDFWYVLVYKETDSNLSLSCYLHVNYKLKCLAAWTNIRKSQPKGRAVFWINLIGLNDRLAPLIRGLGLFVTHSLRETLNLFQIQGRCCLPDLKSRPLCK